MIASIGAWLLSKLMGLASSSIVEKGLELFNKSQDSNVKIREIDAEVSKEAIKAYVEAFKAQSEENKEKWKLPIFQIVGSLILMTVATYFVFLTMYNIFWHADGMFPQEWTIAAYPGIYAEWANTAFNWVFAPAVGLGALLAIVKR